MVSEVAGRLWRLAGWLGAALLPVSALALPGTAETLRCELESGPARAVVTIVDGQTLILDDGSHVRLMGALAPRAYDGGAEDGAWPLEEAARSELQQLALGKSVELGFAGSKIDRHGRLLAQVFLREGDQRLWLQGEMLRRGFARAYGLPGHSSCLSDLLAAEEPAREAGVGLWGHASYQIRAADRHWDLLRFRSTYQVVEGRVLSAADVRGRVYLNFGENRREDFTVTVRPANKRRFEAANIDLTSLKNRRVRVRGWIERRGGPLIEAHHPAQIEVLPE